MNFKPKIFKSLIKEKYPEIDKLLGELFGIKLPIPNFNYLSYELNENIKFITGMHFDPTLPNTIFVHFPVIREYFLTKGQNSIIGPYVHEEAHRRHYRINKDLLKTYNYLNQKFSKGNVTDEDMDQSQFLKIYDESVGYFVQSTLSSKLHYGFNLEEHSGDEHTLKLRLLSETEMNEKYLFSIPSFLFIKDLIKELENVDRPTLMKYFTSPPTEAFQILLPFWTLEFWRNVRVKWQAKMDQEYQKMTPEEKMNYIDKIGKEISSEV